jgi:hypothetical protein
MRAIYRGLVFLLPLLTAALPAHALDLTVCASGCDYASLQSAINAAQPGDTLLLRAGETFTGNFTLPDKGASTQYITIRSDASDAALPPPGHRIKPSHAALLPKIRSGNTSAALTVGLRAHHYRLMFLELLPNDRGFGDIIRLGRNDTTQNDLSLVPHHLELDRVYVHGHPLHGQKRCIALDSASTTIVNSYIADCKGVGQDAMAIGNVNGPGPYLIENNYLEGAGENIIFGGDDPKIPNLVATGITFRRNYLSKPLAWRNPILATPQPTASAATTGGTLAAGTYSYRVRARTTNAYQGQTYNSSTSVEVSATVASGSTGSVTLSWAPVANATEYRVYGRATGTPTDYWTVTGTSFTDTGGAGTAVALPLASATRWLVKNVFELKNARDVTVYGNVIERTWLDAQTGFLVVLTPRNQGGSCTWCVVEDVEMAYNIIRHGAGGVNLLGDDDNHPTQRTRGIWIHDNLFYDIDKAWGGTEELFQILRGPESVTIDHNTADRPDSAQITFDTLPEIVTLTITNNLWKRGDYGIFGSVVGEGTVALDSYAVNWTFRRNTLAGASASRYPADNFFPTVADWEAQFVSYAGDDFHLKPTSPYKNAGTDGKDLGADMAGLDTATAGVIDGNPGGLAADAGGPYSGTAGQPIAFDGTGSSGAASYLWDFGDEIVLRAADFAAADLHGRWQKVADATAADGVRLENANLGDAKITPALAAPVNYVEITFEAAAGVPYHIWVRMKAAGDDWANDSVSAQFSGSVDAAGNPIYRIGTTSGATVFLEEGTNALVQGWGWNDNDYGSLGTPIYFNSDGVQTLRIQQREDGVSFDQIVLSAGTYDDTRPGALKNDATIVPRSLGTATGATVSRSYRFPGTYPVVLTVTDNAGRGPSLPRPENPGCPETSTKPAGRRGPPA